MPKNKIMTIAVDFDSTLAEETIGTSHDSILPNIPLIERLIELKQEGHYIILWTCREGDWLQDAVDFCKGYGLEFDAVNENIQGKTYRDTRKIVADMYIDDRGIHPKDFLLLEKKEL